MCLDSSCPYGLVGGHENVFYFPKDSMAKHKPWPPISPLGRAGLKVIMGSVFLLYSSSRNYLLNTCSVSCLLLHAVGKFRSPSHMALWRELPPAITGKYQCPLKKDPGCSLHFQCEVGLSLLLEESSSPGITSTCQTLHSSAPELGLIFV